jgi:maltose O-acetyltransferase
MTYKTEDEKMLNGVLYNSGDSSLTEKRFRAKILCNAYNGLLDQLLAAEPNIKDLDSRLSHERTAVLKELLGSIKGECIIEAPFRCDYVSILYLHCKLFLRIPPLSAR